MPFVYRIMKGNKMQIDIAICDDEEFICNYIEKELVKLEVEQNEEYIIEKFCSGKDLYEGLKNKQYHLIFLDIELPEIDGVEIGRYIREIQKNNITQIVYISANREYAMDLFKVRPLDFLIKPLDEKKIKEIMTLFVSLNDDSNDVFYYKKGYTECKVNICDIIYFSRENRQVTIYTLHGEDTFYSSLESIYEQLEEYGFLFIHKSYIVNIKFISKIKYDQLWMINQKNLPISQSRRKEIRDKYIQMEKI